MKHNRIIVLLVALAISAVFFIPSGLIAQKSAYTPNKELCAKMIAAGKEYYARGKYLDAKNFFRKAVEADPRSKKAWRYYDQTVVFALAEKIEKKNDLLVPDTSIRSELGIVSPNRPAITSEPVDVVKPEPIPESAGWDEPETAEEEGC